MTKRLDNLYTDHLYLDAVKAGGRIICQTPGCKGVSGFNQRYCLSCRRELNDFSEKRVRKEEMDRCIPQIYFILAVGTGRVKIGTTINIDQRMVDIQCGSPFPLLLLFCIDGGVQIERKIHKYLKKYRILGEWFDMTDEVVDFMEIVKLKGRNGVDDLIDKPQ